MAIPILLTVGALGAGWVVLSRERAKLPGGVRPQVGGDPAVAGPGGIGAAAGSPGSASLIDSGIAGSDTNVQLVTDPSPTVPGALVMGTNEANLSTGGADPATQPSGAGNATLYQGGQLPDDQRASLMIGAFMDPSATVYGDTNGLTRGQQAAALAEVGPLAGLVY